MTLSWLIPSAAPTGRHVGMWRIMEVTGATTISLSTGIASERVTNNVLGLELSYALRPLDTSGFLSGDQRHRLG